MAFGSLSFGLSQFHGHGSWLICEVALRVHPPGSLVEQWITNTQSLLFRMLCRLLSNIYFHESHSANYHAFNLSLCVSLSYHGWLYWYNNIGYVEAICNAQCISLKELPLF